MMQSMIIKWRELHFRNEKRVEKRMLGWGKKKNYPPAVPSSYLHHSLHDDYN
jgi:hypothetical protein